MIPSKVLKSEKKCRVGPIAAVIAISVAVIFLIWWGYSENAIRRLDAAWAILSKPEKLREFISHFGRSAPVAFIFFQILQVIFAPVPGEASGFIGGYLFGTWKGFGYSTIGLTAGSWINFVFARFVGERFVRNKIPVHHLKRFDRLVQRRGIFLVFLLFVIPGFPKDYLCLFLGLTTLPLKIFLVICTLGRMPGTLALSIQGASLYARDYTSLLLISAACLLLLLAAWRYQEKIYAWIAKTANRTRGGKNNETTH